jgi:hypothetical protein
MRKIKTFYIIFCIACIAGLYNLATSDVKVNIKEGVYVLPVAELASTKTYPQIIEMENELIKVALLPNRGRVIASYELKSKDWKFFHTDFEPEPMVLPGGLHSVEFGGYYFSLPWNTRDRQPFDLSFEVRQSDTNISEVYMSGKDMFKKTLTECWIRVRDASTVVELEVKVTNTSSKKPREIDFKDYAVLSVDQASNNGSRILLPVDSVKIERSKDNWLGTEGSTLKWTANQSIWKNMEKYFHVHTAENLKVPCTGVFYPEISSAFVRFWEPESFFTKEEVWSWGKNYKTEEGADAYYVVSCITDTLSLQPKEYVSFTVYMTALEDVGEKAPLNTLYKEAKSSLQ